MTDKTDNHFLHWDTAELVEKYGIPRPWEKHFRSERHFLERIGKRGMSVLDIGCATGDLYHGLAERFDALSYVGVDGAPNMIARAKHLARDASSVTFHESDIFEAGALLGHERFDVVVATGVFQHEPRYRQLLSLMLGYAKEGGHVLFDVKLLSSHPVICDLARGFVDYPERVHYVVLNLSELMDLFLAEPSAGNTLSVFGYYAGRHEKVHLPESVTEEVVSAHVLMRRGPREGTEADVMLHLPAAFLGRAFTHHAGL